MRIDHSRAVGRPAALDFSSVKLFIALPTRGTCSIQFASSMALSVAMLTACGVDVNILENKNGTPIDFNRNNLLARFMNTDCTHIWFVDDDMGWNPDAIVKMIQQDKEFIAGAGPLKKDGEPLFAVKHETNADETPVVVNGLIPCSHVGGAFVLMKREAITRMMINYPGLRCEAVDPQNGYSLYQFEYGSKTWKGEDYVFCERWTSLGGEIWLYPNISFTHTGVKDYTGNYHQHLLNQDQPEDPETVLKEVLADPGSKVTEVPEETKAMLEAEPGSRKDNKFINAMEKIMLCESYIRRIAAAVVQIQDENLIKRMAANSPLERI